MGDSEANLANQTPVSVQYAINKKEVVKWAEQPETMAKSLWHKQEGGYIKP